MRKHGRSKTMSLLATCILFTQMMIAGVIVAPVAQADAPWPIALSGEVSGVVDAVFTHGDGSVSAVSNGFQTYNNAGTLTTSKTSSEVYANSIWSAAGVDGTIFANFITSSYGTQTDSGLAAYKNGVQLWHTVGTAFAPCASGSNQLYPMAKWVKLGYQSDIYAIVASKCSTVPSRLIRVDAGSGEVLFDVALSSSGDFEAQGENNERLWVLPSGVRVFDGMDLRTFTNSLTVNLTQHLPLVAGEAAGISGSNATGDVYIAAYKYGANCGGTYNTRVIRMNVDDTTSDIDISSYCKVTQSLRVAPDGDIVFMDMYSTLYRFAADGSLRYSLPLASWSGHDSVYATSPLVDANGDIITARSGQSYTYSHGRDVQALKINATTGTMTEVFTTETIVTNSYSYFTPNQMYLNGLGNGVFYLPICPNASSCSASIPTKLYKVEVSGLAMDYPRSAVMASYAQKRNYVAMGDSYSSGEGNPPFLGQSAANGCNRSAVAYPKLLSANSTNIELTHFVACSGATTADIENGKPGTSEPSQLSALDSSTDIVTITAGGDDINFVSFATACAGVTIILTNTRCGTGTSAYQDAYNAIYGDLGINLEYLYEQIVVRAPNAQIYVIGYPFLASSSWTSSCPGYLDDADPGNSIGSDTEGAYLIVSALNLVTSQAASATNSSRVHFIDPNNGTYTPFASHGLCSSDSFFTELQFGAQMYAFHPNVDGQIAYTNVVIGGM